MAEVNPYQGSTAGESERRPERPPFDPETAGIPRQSLWIILGVSVLLAATLGVVVTSGLLGVIDRFVPVSWFIFTGTTIGALTSVGLGAGAALAWLAWRLHEKGYPRRRLVAILAAGWAAGLLCVVAIVRSDTAMEERQAESVCGLIKIQQGAKGSDGDLVARCTAELLRCRRAIRRQPGYSELTDDAERAMMNDCMTRHFDPSR